jgi:hypothetical protein
VGLGGLEGANSDKNHKNKAKAKPIELELTCYM